MKLFKLMVTSTKIIDFQKNILGVCLINQTIKPRTIGNFAIA